MFFRRCAALSDRVASGEYTERVPGQNTGDKYRRCVRDRTGCGTGSEKRMVSAADPVFKGWLMWRFYDIFLFRT